MSEQIYTDVQAQKMVRDYACAACWGHLIIEHIKSSRNVLVTCPNCGDGRGFVTKKYADRKRAESRSEAFEARKNLANSMPGLQMPRRSESDILKDLGF